MYIYMLGYVSVQEFVIIAKNMLLANILFLVTSTLASRITFLDEVSSYQIDILANYN